MGSGTRRSNAGTPTRTSTDVLTPDRIKPYLRHEDPSLRLAAIDYFADSWSRDPEVLPMILDACERHGDAENVRGLSIGNRFLLTESSLDRVLGHLARAGDR